MFTLRIGYGLDSIHQPFQVGSLPNTLRFVKSYEMMIQRENQIATAGVAAAARCDRYPPHHHHDKQP